MIPFGIDSRRRQDIKIDWNINRGLKQDKSYVELYGKTSGLIGLFLCNKLNYILILVMVICVYLM